MNTIDIMEASNQVTSNNMISGLTGTATNQSLSGGLQGIGSRGRSGLMNKTPDIKSQFKKNDILSINNSNSNNQAANGSNLANQMMVRGRSDKAHTSLAQYTSHELPKVNV